jgi:hypothetical protein
MRSLLSVSMVAALVLLLGVACSASSTPAQCNTQPFTCGAGKTCWPSDNSANFACLASGLGKSGDACQNTPTAATCGDGLMCLQQTSTDGHCVPWCDSAHGCPSGESCTAAQIGGTTQIVHVCFGGGAPPADAGG